MLACNPLPINPFRWTARLLEVIGIVMPYNYLLILSSGNCCRDVILLLNWCTQHESRPKKKQSETNGRFMISISSKRISSEFTHQMCNVIQTPGVRYSAQITRHRIPSAKYCDPRTGRWPPNVKHKVLTTNNRF